jgi:hypothetical protein
MTITNCMLRVTTVLVCVLIAFSAAQSAETPTVICDIAIHEEQQELEEARLAVDLARTDFNAFEEVFLLIDGLWEADAIPELVYLEARYDRNSARLVLERADLMLERQLALVDAYRLACGKDKPSNTDGDSLQELLRRYRRTDCDQQAKAIKIAKTDLEFSRVLLKSVLSLRKGEVATKQDVIFAERDVERGTKRLVDAENRTAACRERSGVTGED